jgi:hypothetical protein
MLLLKTKESVGGENFEITFDGSRKNHSQRVLTHTNTFMR